MKNKKKKHIDNPLSAIKNNILPPNSLTENANAKIGC